MSLTNLSSFSKRQTDGNSGTDAFYTKPAVITRCVRFISGILRKASFVLDASAGDGAFVTEMRRQLKEQSPDSYQFDLAPAAGAPEVKKKDALKIGKRDIDSRSGGVYGFNPPFGYASGLARRLIRHGIAIQDPDWICVILPAASGSRSIWTGYKLKKKLVLPRESFFDPHTNLPFAYETAFFVWQKQADGSTDSLPVVTNNTEFVKWSSNVFDPAKIERRGTVFAVRRVGSSCGKNGYVRYRGRWYGYRLSIFDWDVEISEPERTDQFICLHLKGATKPMIENIALALFDARKGLATTNISISFVYRVLNGFR